MGKRVLLVGATGVFGSNLADMLCRIDGVELVLAARSPAALAALKARLEADHPAATLGLQVFDRRRPAELRALNPWLVIDAAGPFQHSDYGLALTAVRAGAHYIDLADGRAFVAGFPQAVSSEASATGCLL